LEEKCEYNVAELIPAASAIVRIEVPAKPSVAKEDSAEARMRPFVPGGRELVGRLG